MSEPFIFSSTTPTARLPLLVPGQAQKEFFLNQALSILDALCPQAVVASQGAPPAAIADSACFRVTSPASEGWAGNEDHLAIGIGGDWHFVASREGMQVFDADAGHWLVFRSGWRAAVAPVIAEGGSLIDTEARAALAQLIEALHHLGILATPTV
jgi:hypothetical protein